MRSGQVSFEYLMVFGLALAFAIPVWIYATTMQQSAGEELSLSYTKNAADQITAASDLVYAQGPPAKIRLSVYIPSRVEGINITDKTITLNVSSSAGFSDIFSTSSATMNGTLPSSEGMYRISVESKGSYVQISVE
jgi:uncharacterized protein (UPF0333 family)